MKNMDKRGATSNGSSRLGLVLQAHCVTLQLSPFLTSAQRKPLEGECDLVIELSVKDVPNSKLKVPCHRLIVLSSSETLASMTKKRPSEETYVLEIECKNDAQVVHYQKLFKSLYTPTSVEFHEMFAMLALLQQFEMKNQECVMQHHMNCQTNNVAFAKLCLEKLAENCMLSIDDGIVLKSIETLMLSSGDKSVLGEIGIRWIGGFIRFASFRMDEENNKSTEMLLSVIDCYWSDGKNDSSGLVYLMDMVVDKAIRELRDSSCVHIVAELTYNYSRYRFMDTLCFEYRMGIVNKICTELLDSGREHTFSTPTFQF